MMTRYILQDSDWSFDDTEFPGIEVEAETVQDAATLAIQKLIETDPHDGGVHFKIAHVGPPRTLIGFMSATWENGVAALEEFQPFGDGQP